MTSNIYIINKYKIYKWYKKEKFELNTSVQR